MLSKLLLMLFDIFPPVRKLAWRAGRSVYCLARRDQQPNSIAINGEADVQACVIRALPRETVLRAVDIGANRGEWTLSLLTQAAALGRAGVKVDLFEPVPSTIARLREALSMAGANDRVEVNEMALSERTGTVRMAIVSASGGTNSLEFDERDGAPAGGWIDVEATSLTHYCDEHAVAHLHIAKCDAEGHDLKVILGAADLLRHSRIDVLQFEYNHRWVLSHSFLKDVFDLISPLPYQLARISPSFIEVFPSWHPELDRFFEANYVIVHDRALPWFDARFGGFDASNVYCTYDRGGAKSTGQS